MNAASGAGPARVASSLKGTFIWEHCGELRGPVLESGGAQLSGGVFGDFSSSAFSSAGGLRL